jgi:hypothetical protein
LVKERVTVYRVSGHELGLELVHTEATLQLYNPYTKEFLLTPAEGYARAVAEAARAEEEAARAARLAAKLCALGLDPDQL